MRGKILFAAGLAAGYVIGARAGRPAYEALTERLSGAREDPTVQRIGGTAKAKLEEKAPAVADVAEQAAATVQEVAAAASDAAPTTPGAPAAESTEDRSEAPAGKPTSSKRSAPKPGGGRATGGKPADATTPAA